jgi:hypothetical protein
MHTENVTRDSSPIKRSGSLLEGCSVFDSALYRNREAKAVLQLLYTETTAVEWLFHQEKPPCTNWISAHSLENRSKKRWLLLSSDWF